MEITSVEVIRRNSGVAGHPVIGVPAGEKLPVEVGDIVRVYLKIDYQGPAIENGELQVGIGWQLAVGFTEAYIGQTSGINFSESVDFITHDLICDVPIDRALGPLELSLYGNVLDMYGKLWNVPGPNIFCYAYDVIEVSVEPPVVEYEEIQHTIYHFAYIYEGDVEVTTATFKTDPFTPSAWMAETFASKLEEEVRANGGKPLEVKVYVDTSPLLWTNFKIVIKSTPLGEAGGVAVGIPLWASILIIALAIIAIIVVVTLAFKTVVESFPRKPGLEDLKPTWGKEALILDIRDSEEYWERPLTPVETLQGMSEAELRDHLDLIAEEEVPTAVGWGALVFVGGIALLGVGAAVALAARPKE